MQVHDRRRSTITVVSIGQAVLQQGACSIEILRLKVKSWEASSAYSGKRGQGGSERVHCVFEARPRLAGRVWNLNLNEKRGRQKNIQNNVSISRMALVRGRPQVA